MDSLSQEAGQQRSLLKSKQVEAERALQGITVAMESAGSHRQEVSVLQKQLALDQVGFAGQQLPLLCTSKTGCMPGLKETGSQSVRQSQAFIACGCREPILGDSHTAGEMWAW